MRVLALMAIALACRSSSPPNPSVSVAPLNPTEHSRLGCYRLQLIGIEPGLVFTWGSEWAPAELAVRLDSAPSKWGGQTAVFLEGMPAQLRSALVSWELRSDTVFVNQEAGREGQGVRLALSTVGDTVRGEARWHWSISGGPSRGAPLRGTRYACP